MESSDRSRITRRRLVQDGLILTSGIASGTLLAGRAEAQADTPDAVHAQRWTIGNEQIERVVVFTPGVGLYTEELTDKTTGATFIVPGKLRKDMAIEFSFNAMARRIVEPTRALT